MQYADLAAQSLALYQELRDELRRMLPKIGAAETGWISAMDGNIARLLRAIEQTDSALMASAPPQPRTGDQGRLTGLLAKRRQVMAEVLSLNKEAVAQAESIKSLLGHDLAALRAGRQALDGYAPHGLDGSGGIINHQF